MPTTLRAKCIVVGDAAVGKTSIAQVFHSDNSQFPKNYTMEFFILDSSGKELFSEVSQKHWEHPSMVMVVYDVTSDTSFSSCEKWLERVRAQKPGVKFPGVLLANKVDLEERRVISMAAGLELAQAKGLQYFECSAKHKQNVDQAFMYLANAYHQLYQSKVEMFKGMG